MLWLDLKLFGNGRGMSAPDHDQRFYWLSGRLYTFMLGHGAQLHSYQWLHPNAGERRKLAGREYRPFNSVRRGPRVRVAWATKLPVDLDAANAELRAIETHLGKNAIATETRSAETVKQGSVEDEGVGRRHCPTPPIENIP